MRGWVAGRWWVRVILLISHEGEAQEAVVHAQAADTK